MNLYLDIETIPAQDPRVLERIIAEAEEEKKLCKAPKNIKDSDKITAAIAEKHAEIDASVDERYRKTALDGAYGSIYCAAIAIDGAPPVGIIGATERETLEALFSDMKQAFQENNRSRPTFIGHNLLGFDLRFIFQRAVVLGVRPPFGVPFNAKPWDDVVFDTMTAWAGMRGFVSMDRISQALDLPGKGEIDGSKVWDYVQAGRGDEVVKYCCDDVERTRTLHRRLTWGDL